MERRGALTQQKEATRGGGGVKGGSVVQTTASRLSVKVPPRLWSVRHTPHRVKHVDSHGILWQKFSLIPSVV